MVRKRSRTARKYYDENDSDSDYTLEDPPSEPAPKKYSLRQRKRRLFTEFEFDDDGEEIEPTKVPSDDDDFEVDKELDETPDTEYTEKDTYANHYEADNEDLPEDGDGLIDFEDMIRADIVVNKNRIDYDNIIQKTEIKVEPIIETIQPVIKSKRGRKPKAKPEGHIDSSLLEPETEMKEDEFDDRNDKDYNPADDTDSEELIDCAQLMQAELSECANEISSVPTKETKNDSNIDDTILGHETMKTQEEPIRSDNVDENINTTEEQVAKPNENDLSNVSRDTTDINGEVALPLCSNDPLTTDDLLQVTKTIILDNDDDDVVLVEDEKKCEVIVLDD